VKRIKLTQGQFALVDDEDFERLNAYKWYAMWNQSAKSYYAARMSPRKKGEKRHMISMHRYIMVAKPGEKVDHRNRNTLDNQKSNLRICTQGQNNTNVGVRTDNKSGFKGVSWHGASKRWQADICVNGNGKYIGIYSTPEEAAHAYDISAIELHGEFAVTNKSLGLLG